MCNFGGDDRTRADTTQSYKPAGNKTFQDIIARGQATSQLPYTPITQGVANLTPSQLQAQASVGQQSPYMASAAAHFENASEPLTAAQISQYLNPYISNVTANMNEVFGQQQRDTTGKLTGAAGGLGANRIAVGQAELARQQGLAAGQTYAGIYQNALQAAQNQQGIEQASAYGLGNLSQAQLQQYLAQFGLGTAEQQTQQMALNAAYNQQMAQAAYPFQTAQWYAGLALPAAGSMGGTTRGTQTVNPPDPNAWSQIAGLGLTALGAFAPAKDGGRIKGYATGGSPYNASGSMFSGEGSYIPAIQMPTMSGQQGNQPLSYLSPSQDASMGGVGGKGSNIQAGRGARGIYDSLFTTADPTGGGWGATVSPSGMSGWGNFLSNMMPFKSGGRVEDSGPYKVLTSIAMGKGGEVEKDLGGSLGGLGGFLNPILGGKDESGGIASAFGLRPIWEAVKNPSPYSILGMMSQGHRQPAPTAQGETPIEKNFYYMPATRNGMAGYKVWEQAPNDLEINRLFGNVTFAKGGKVNGYADGGSPLSPYMTMDNKVFGLKPIPFMNPESYPISPSLRNLWDPTQKPIQDRFEGPPKPMPSDDTANVTSQARLLPKAYTSPFTNEAVAEAMPAGVSDAAMIDMPNEAGGEPPVKDYNVYDPDKGGYIKDPLGKYVPGKQYKWSNTPQDPSQITAGPGTIPEEGDTQFTEGVNGPVSPNATPFTLASQPGEEGSPGTGRWSAAFANVPPWERPKLFGKELSNTNLFLMAAGLGMLGGESPHFGVNIGQGGLKGIAELKEFQEMDAQRQARALQNILEAGRLDLGESQMVQQESLKKLQIGAQLLAQGRDDDDQDAMALGRKFIAESGVASEEALAPIMKPKPSAPTSVMSIEPTYPEGMDPHVAVNTDSVPEGLDLWYERQKFGPRGKNLYKQTGEMMKDLREKADASREVLRSTMEANHYLDVLPQTGLLTPGTAQIFRKDIALLGNTLARASGYTMEQATKDIGNAEALQKLQTYSGFNLARTLGTREAMQVIQQALAAVANGQMSPAGAKNIVYSVMAGQRYNADKYKFVSNWQAKYGMTGEADVYFDEKIGPQAKYVAMIEKMKELDELRRHADPEDAKALFDAAAKQYGITPEYYGGTYGQQ